MVAFQLVLLNQHDKICENDRVKKNKQPDIIMPLAEAACISEIKINKWNKWLYFHTTSGIAADNDNGRMNTRDRIIIIAIKSLCINGCGCGSMA